ncbi:hypothetical protein T484DRAFT_1779381 [Baffinella frigidus]|nr:hypothetical protein T484DRAFT_1779381 [Cryptophyta sp. CCMP2293]
MAGECGRHKRCEFNCEEDQSARCSRQPTYGDRRDGVARYCAKHRLPEHADVRSRVCQAPTP